MSFKKARTKIKRGGSLGPMIGNSLMQQYYGCRGANDDIKVPYVSRKADVKQSAGTDGDRSFPRYLIIGNDRGSP